MKNNILQQYYNFNLQESFRHLETETVTDVKNQLSANKTKENTIISFIFSKPELMAKVNNFETINCTSETDIENAAFFLKDVGNGQNVFVFDNQNNRVFLVKGVRIEVYSKRQTGEDEYGLRLVFANLRVKEDRRKKISLSNTTSLQDSYEDYKKKRFLMCHIFPIDTEMIIDDRYGEPMTDTFYFSWLSPENQDILFRNLMKNYL